MPAAFRPDEEAQTEIVPSVYLIDKPGASQSQIRIGHLGDLNEGICLTALAIAEMALTDAGAKIELGSGVAAAQEWYRTSNGSALKVAAE